MGSITDAQVRVWQKHAGIELPPTVICLLWRELQELMVQANRIAVLETSGIRDGDSTWHGSSASHEIILDLQAVCARLLHAYHTVDWNSPSNRADIEEARDFGFNSEIGVRLAQEGNHLALVADEIKKRRREQEIRKQLEAEDGPEAA
jgi:hypothetical protein